MLVRLTSGWGERVPHPRNLVGYKGKGVWGEDHFLSHSWVDVTLPLSVSDEGVFLSLHSQGRTVMALWKNYFTSQYSKALSVWNVTFHKVFCMYSDSISSVKFSRSVVSDSLRPHESQHARPPCPSPTPRVYTNSCPLSQSCHPAISSSVVPFSSCPQSFPASGSFQMNQLFTSDGQSIGVSVSTSVLPMNTQDWSPLRWTGWISLQSKGLSRVFCNTTVQKHQFLSAQLSL